MAWLLGFVGLIFGLLCAEAGEWALGLFGGTLLGALAGAWFSLRARVEELESRLRSLQSLARSEAGFARTAPPAAATQTAAVEPAAAASVAEAAPAPTPSRAPPPLPQAKAPISAPSPQEAASMLELEPMAPSAEESIEIDALDAIEAAAPGPKPPPLPRREPAPAMRAAPSEQSALAKWLFESSWIAKIGIGLVLIAVGALLRLAVREGWFNFPIELRLAGIAAGALVALAIGWRQREAKRVFALNLQGGAIAVLMMVVFTAYRNFHLIPAEATFFLLIVLVAATALLAIRQNSLGLAVFGVIGGFAAPILASSGSGNHVALFSFYLILNLAIVAISWARGWRILNSLGFLFTFVIATAWGASKYTPALFATTEPFLIAFFFLYLAIPLLPALRGLDPDRRDHVAGSLVFGTPLVGFALQSAMLYDDRPALALTALVMSAIYVVLARYVWAHHQLGRWRSAYAGLALVFATLVIPLAFTSGTTTVLWAIEGALLVWIGLAQDERRLRWAGLALQLLAGFMLLDVGAPAHDAPLLFNPTALGALALALAALFSAWRYTLAHASHPLIGGLAAYGFVAWYVGGVMEVDRWIGHPHESHAVLVFVAASAAIAAWLRPRSGLRAFSWPGFLLQLSLPLFVFLTDEEALAPLVGAGAWVWPLAFACVLATLHWLRDPWPRGLGWAHVIAWLSLPLLAAVELASRTGMSPQIVGVLSGLGGDWPFVITTLPFWLALSALLTDLRLVGAPLPDEFPRYRQRALWPLLIGGALFVFVACLLEGRAPPIAYLPVLNPLELSQIGVLLLMLRFAARELDDGAADGVRMLVSLLAFVALSAAVLRGVHHFGHEAWNADLLTRPKAHAALSWTWTLLGAAAMGFGAKSLVRGAWIAGAVLLGVVVVKLLLVDMRFLGTLSGIASVLGVGVLFVALGYLAPMPPRNAEEAA
jgi:uncharacterized membrane protein